MRFDVSYKKTSFLIFVLKKHNAVETISIKEYTWRERLFRSINVLMEVHMGFVPSSEKSKGMGDNSKKSSGFV